MPDYVDTPVKFGDTMRPFRIRRGSSDTSVLKQVFDRQQFSLKRLRRVGELLDFVKRGMATGRKPLIIDAGANIGAASAYFAAVFPKSLVISVEPDRENLELLRKNVTGFNVQPMLGAIAAQAGRAQLVDTGGGPWAYRTEPAAPEADAANTVPNVTIDELFAGQAATCFPFIVKMDIEGAEREVFSANTDWVARTPLLILELHDWMMPKARTSAPFLKCIAQQDRDFVYLGEEVFSIANDLDALLPT